MFRLLQTALNSHVIFAVKQLKDCGRKCVFCVTANNHLLVFSWSDIIQHQLFSDTSSFDLRSKNHSSPESLECLGGQTACLAQGQYGSNNDRTEGRHQLSVSAVSPLTRGWALRSLYLWMPGLFFSYFCWIDCLCVQYSQFCMCSDARSQKATGALN